MSTEVNKAIAQRCIDAINRQDVTAMGETMSPKWVAEVAGWFPGVNARWPGHHIEVAEMVAEGERVWCRLRTSALGQGEWMGLPATGKPWSNTGIWYLRIVDGKIIELESLFDELNLIRQYGGQVAPAPLSAGSAANAIQGEGQSS